MAQAKYIGGGSGALDLDGEVFSESFHGPVVHEAVRAELAARRRGTHSAKTRAEVAMTGAKAWRQKGTGRARGGVAFAPKPRDYTVKVNRKAHRRALRAALSLHAERGSIAAIDPSGFVPPSTRTAAAALADWEGDGTVLVVLSDGEEACARSFRNIADVSVVRVDRVGVVDIVGAGRLVVSGSALERLTEKAVAK